MRDLRAAVDSFEEGYLERAREAVDALAPAEIRAVTVHRKAVPPRDGGAVLAGWWCEPSADPRVLVLPNPWDRREAIPLLEEYCWELCRSLAHELGQALNRAHGVEHRDAYWESLLLRWLLHAVAVAVDRRLFCAAAVRLAPDAGWESGGELPVPESCLEGVNAFLTDEGNASILTKLARLMERPLLALPAGSPSPGRPALVQRRSVWGQLSHPRSLLRILGNLAAPILIRPRSVQRVVLTGHARFQLGQLLELRRRVPGLTIRPLRRRSRQAGDGSEQHGDGKRQALSGIEASDQRAQAVAALLPGLLPRSLLEGYEAVVRESARSYGATAATVIANYGLDERENEFIGRSRETGKPIAFAQHGGAYLQHRTHVSSRLELREDSVFAAWGNVDAGPGHVVKAPDPHLARLRDSYRGGDKVVIVEWLAPPLPYLIDFASIPQANQGYEVAEWLAALVDRLALDRRLLALKRFPTHYGREHRPPQLEALDGKAPSRSPSAAEWMRRARVAVIAYPDTPFIEAMAIGVPTIGLWNPDRWEMRDDAAPYFEELAELGIVHRDPAAAAATLDRIYAEADEWWSAPEIQAARMRFLDRFAADGDWRGPWVKLLAGLAGADR